MSTDVIVGYVFGLLTSLLSGAALFWLEGRRDARRDAMERRRADARFARDWAASGRKTSLRGFDLAGESLSGKDLAGADLELANFNGASLYGTDLSGANLIKASFRGAKVVGANLAGADLLGADFTGAMVSKTDFSRTKMHKTKFRRAKEVVGCTWTDAQIDETAELSMVVLQEIRETQSQVSLPHSTRLVKVTRRGASRKGKVE